MNKNLLDIVLMAMVNVPMCECGDGSRYVLKTSHTQDNPDHKFWSCKNKKKVVN